MKIITVKNMEELSKRLAVEFLSSISQPNATIGLPGGSTPIGMYQLVAPLIKHNPALKTAVYCNLDEAISVDGRIKSVNALLNHHFYHRNDIGDEQRFDLNLDNVAEFEQFLAARGGLDAIYLGVGTDGHIAGITPGTPFANRTFIDKMTPMFKQIAQQEFGGLNNTPDKLVTAGPKTVMQAKKITVMLSGAGKADIAKQAFLGPVTEAIPASILQLHPNVTVLIDEAAAAKL
ncbi:6-phosphogluconolactonase [Orbus sturtevantii]|uniref:6-phosphogluconolactonase n=1 Tax=Orbus sturtevantii TaxID=3074109 RepID=UPI00370D0466